MPFACVPCVFEARLAGSIPCRCYLGLADARLAAPAAGQGWTMISDLVGIGIYTPAEAARLTGVSAGRIIRWLRGHKVRGSRYEPLWKPQIDIEDGRVYLGFRDLMEVRVAAAFIKHGLSPQKVRRAIQIARDLFGKDHPLSTRNFRTDGRSVFLQLSREDGEDRLIDLFRQQYEFQKIVEPSLKHIEFDASGVPSRWYPRGPAAHVVVDPTRSFGRPIEVESGVPTGVLAAAARAEGSVEAAAKAWNVPIRSVRRSIEFEEALHGRLAA